MNMICEFINKAAVMIAFRNVTKNYTQSKQIKAKTKLIGVCFK